MKVRELVMLLIEHASPDADVQIESSFGEYGSADVDGIDVFAGMPILIKADSAQHTSPEQEQRRIDAERKRLEQEEQRNQERKEKLREKLAGWGLTEADLPEAR